MPTVRRIECIAAIGACGLGLALCAAPSATANADASAAPVNREKSAFDDADSNQDRWLSLEEYTAREGNRAVLLRDFRLFDLDHNSKLSAAEFLAIPGVVPASRRKAIPDPFEHLVESALNAMAETLKLAGHGNAARVPIGVFVSLVASSLPQEHSPATAAAWSSLADPDADGQVTREEQRRFFEIQLGVRAPSGELLREPTGRVVALGQFLRMDQDRDGAVDREEYLRHPNDGVVQQDFSAADRDGDGLLTLAEFCSTDGPGFFDSIAWFRDADTDLDGLLNASEAVAATEPFSQALIAASFHGFDDDHNDKLSLDEFRLSVLGNPIFSGARAPRDADWDGKVSYEEFRFPPVSVDLLRLYYFSRFDADGDLHVSHQEFPFAKNPPRTFQLLAADGSAMRKLYDNEEYPHCGSPSVSPDGLRIAFDGRHGGQSLQEQRILMMSFDGTGFRDICEGLMPTWSKDGKQFACSRYRPQNGIWIIDADGSNPRHVADGWGAQWSPDGRTIAHTNRNGVWAYDVAADKSREVLSAADHPYQLIYWNMCWSPDSRRLIFCADKHQWKEIASISMEGDGPDLKTHFSTELPIDVDYGWSLDGRRVLFGMRGPKDRNMVLYELDPTSDDPPQLVAGVDESLTYRGCCFTPDGKWIIVGAQDSE